MHIHSYHPELEFMFASDTDAIILENEEQEVLVPHRVITLFLDDAFFPSGNLGDHVDFFKKCVLKDSKGMHYKISADLIYYYHLDMGDGDSQPALFAKNLKYIRKCDQWDS